ncbi:MAG: hypothetical protein JWM11_3460 [Planctomycetaceae bacterium]|nr:hypothetical protein [Planctomycetaceae bacterium]
MKLKLKLTFVGVAFIVLFQSVFVLSHVGAQTGGVPKEGQLDTPRIKVPESGELQAAVKKVREVYATDFKAAKNPQLKWSLALKLGTLAQETKEDTLSEYALATEAIALYTSVGDVLSAFRLVDELALTFEMKPVAEKLELFRKAAKDTKVVPLKRMLALVGLKLAGDAEAAEDWDASKDVAKLSVTLARASHDNAVVKRANEQNVRYTDLQKVWQQVVDARKKLTSSPDDPEANGVVGRYLCFVRQDWDQGLAYLSKGAKLELKAIAAKDQATARDVDSQSATADAWWAFAESKKGNERVQIFPRVAYWYEQILPNVSGLAKVTAEKRLETAYEAMSGRKFKKILSEPPTGVLIEGIVNCETGIQPVTVPDTFDLKKSWLVTFDFMAPHLNGGRHSLFFWGDGRGGHDAFIVLYNGPQLHCAVEDTVAERGQSISVPLASTVVGKWVNVKFLHDSISNELELYIDNRLIRKDALTITPQLDRAMTLYLGGQDDSNNRYTGQLRNIWMGNIQ